MILKCPACSFDGIAMVTMGGGTYSNLILDVTMKHCKSSDASLYRACNKGLNPREKKNLNALLYATTMVGIFLFGMGIASM
jgi:hypothetical protein